MSGQRQIHAIDSDFDGGNIVVEAIEGACAQLTIRRDTCAQWAQWFHFKVDADPGALVDLQILNAGECSYPEGWECYRACVSEDGRAWTRTETAYVSGKLVIRHRMAGSQVQVAYFAPYGLDEHIDLLWRSTPFCAADTLAETPGARRVDRLRFGFGPFKIWLLGRQHPGEPMASWWMEGAVRRLIEMVGVRSKFFQSASVNVVPMVNPDGVASGNLRANARGRDLNREWAHPDPREAPEVAGILGEMSRIGVDLVLDVHGDECIPHVFLDSGQGAPNAGLSKSQTAGVARFSKLLGARNPAFQTAVGYPRTYAGEGAASMCARAVAARFGAVGMTLEMPFGQSKEAPDPLHGWSPEASATLGRDCVDSLILWLNGAC